MNGGETFQLDRYGFGAERASFREGFSNHEKVLYGMKK
jgi:hypothetical protein